MLEIKFIRENPELVEREAKNKGVKINIDKLLELDRQKRQYLQKTEGLRRELNLLSKKKPEPKQIEKGRKIKTELKKLEEKLKASEEELNLLMLQVPNLPAPDVKIGKDESENEILRQVGKPRQFEFKPKDHLEIGERLDLIDVERAAKVSGSRFGYLKGQLVLLEFALIRFALDTLVKEGFIPVLPPVLIKREMMAGMGYLEHNGDQEMYMLEKDGLVLVGTSEQSIGPMHQDEIFSRQDLPQRYTGFSTCFRREAGSYGKDTRGILRVHQFNKVEMFSYTTPEKGDEEHEFLLSLEEKLMQGLELPYQVVKMCSGDLGAPAARKYDLEAWFPGQGKYREVTSTSTTTDFQARRLNIRYRDGKEIKFVHMLNGTAFSERPLIAILENYQQKDGSVKVPKVLEKYCGFEVIVKK